MKKSHLIQFAFFLFTVTFFQKTFSQGVNITAPSLAINSCSFPTSYSALGNIVITETQNADFLNSGTLILTMPANFELQPATGIVTFNIGENIVSATIAITATKITVTYTLGNTNKSDVLTISGLRVRGTVGASGPSSLLRLATSAAGGTGTISGDAPGQGKIHASFTSTLTAPLIITQPLSQTICTGNAVTFTVGHSNGTSFQWYKGAIPLLNGGNISGATTASLTINPVSAADMSPNYNVVVSNACLINVTSASASLTTVSPPAASISYDNSPYCRGNGTAMVTQTGTTGGTYSSAAGLSIAPSTGDINLAASSPGTYTVTYTFSNGYCSRTTTGIISIIGPLNKTVSSPVTSLCISNTGTNITVAASSIGATYQLRNSSDNSVVGTAVAGNGGTLSFPTGSLTSTTTFNIYATDNSSGCSVELPATRTITVLPDATISSNYCLLPGKVRLTATGGGTYKWTTGATTDIIDVDVAGTYSITVTNALGCQYTKTIVVGEELTVNGDFSAGNTGFLTQYNYAPAANALQPEGTYAINNNANYNHTNFWGTDYTSGGTGTGNFMIVNGSPATVRPIVWQQNIAVKQNTTYYFSAWAMSMNNVGNYARLRFAVDGVQIGTIDTLTTGATSAAGPFNWTRFYGTWNSGTSTSAVLSIVDLQNAATGNDFGIDGISAGSLIPPPVSIIATNSNPCAGNTLNITSTVTGGAPPYLYQWTGPNGFTSSAANPVISNASAIHSGVYTLSIVDAYGCTYSGSTTAAVYPIPSITLSSSSAATVCSRAAAQTTTLDYSGTTNSPSSYNITWNNSPANSFVAVTNAALPPSPIIINVPAGTPAGSYTGTLVVKTSQGCASASKVFTLAVNGTPAATISGTTSVCVNSGSPVITFTASGGTAPYTFTYKINAGANQTVTTTSGNSVTVAVPTIAAGTFVYTLISVQDASSTMCSQTQSGTATVTVNPLPTATISGTTAVCKNASSPNITFTGAAGTAPYTFTYKINSGANQTVTTTSGNTVTIAVPTGSPGSFVYTLVSVQDASSSTCLQTQSGTATVTVNPLPTAAISGTTAVCAGSASPNITFTGGAGTAPYTFTYKINSGANQTVTTTSGNSVTVAAPATSAGSFVYSLVSVQDASSTTCSQTQSGTATVTVNPLPTANISGIADVCVGSASPNITFTGANGTAPYTFTYNVNGGANQTITASGNSVSLPVSTTAVGTFTYNLVSVQDGSSTSCSQTQSGTATITVNPLPAITLASFSATVCYNAAAQTTSLAYSAISNSPTTYSITWSSSPANSFVTVTDAAISSTPIIINIPAATPAGTYTGTLTVKTAYGCESGANNFTLQINPIPAATISGNATVCKNTASRNVTFTGSLGTAPYTFYYTLNNGATQSITTTSGSSVFITVPTTTAGTFAYKLLSVTDASSSLCSRNYASTATVTIKPLPTATLSGGDFCKAGSTTLTLSNVTGGAFTGTSFSSTPAGLSLNSSTGNIDLAASVAGNYTVTYNYTGANACAPLAGTNTSAVIIEPKPVINIQPSDITFCPELSTATFTANVSGATSYQWQQSIDDGLTYNDINSGTGYLSGEQSSSILISDIPNHLELDGTKYQLKVSAVPACPVTTSAGKLAILNFWKGNISNVWSNPLNWTSRQLPVLSCDDVVITALGNECILNDITAPVNNIRILPNASLTVNNTGILQIAKGIFRDPAAIFDVTRGTVEMNGITPQTIPDLAFTYKTILNLKISNSVSQLGEDTVTGTLALLYPGKTFSTNNYLTLKSTAARTANVAPIPMDAAGYALSFITGNVHIERYVPAIRAWRLLSAPITSASTQTINQAWQEGVVNSSADIKYDTLPGYGTHITGPSPGKVTGMDLSPANNWSLRRYEQAINDWIGVGNSMTTPINYLEGYMLFVRGSRSTDLNQNANAVPTNTTLRITGKIKTGTQVYTPLNTGFNVIGNPYPSSINFNRVASHVENKQKIYVWDPVLNPQVRGGFQNGVLCNVNGRDRYRLIPGGGSYPIDADGKSYLDSINSGQAFFAFANNLTPYIFDESSKIDLNNFPSLYNAANNPDEEFESSLLRVNASGLNSVIDANLVLFNADYSIAMDAYDAPKFANYSEGFGIAKASRIWAVEKRTYINSADTIYYNLTAVKPGKYQLVFKPQELVKPGLTAFLIDSFLNTATPVSLSEKTVVDVVVTTDPKSAAKNRFKIVFTAPLVFKFQSVEAVTMPGGINISWSVENEYERDIYTIERSTDSIHFKSIDNMAPRNAGPAASFNFKDENPPPGINFYRIKSVGKNGEITYSDIVKSVYLLSKPSVTIFPNPVTGRTINVQFKNMPKGVYYLRLLDFFKNEIMFTRIKIAGNAIVPLNILRYSLSGFHYVEVVKPGYNRIYIPVIILRNSKHLKPQMLIK